MLNSNTFLSHDLVLASFQSTQLHCTQLLQGKKSSLRLI